MEPKLEIMSLFSSELKKPLFSTSHRDTKVLATLLSETADCRYAEEFIFLKETR